MKQREKYPWTCKVYLALLPSLFFSVVLCSLFAKKVNGALIMELHLILYHLVQYHLIVFLILLHQTGYEHQGIIHKYIVISICL
jgi:hypothetical protein